MSRSAGKSTITAVRPRSLNGSELLPDLSTELLKQGYKVRFRAVGWSMYPTIRDGELITVEPVKPREVKWGDIVLYRIGWRIFAHRLVGRKRRVKGGKTVSGREAGPPGKLILRGDRPGSPGEPVGESQILGKVISVERKSRTRNLAGAGRKLLQAPRFLLAGLLGWLYGRISCKRGE